MHFYGTFLLAAVAQFTMSVTGNPVSAPARRELSGGGYATFYDDNACHTNPTVAVSMHNTGCITNEGGKHSIYIQPGASDTGGGRTLSLVWSPGTSCNCQNDCQAVAHNGGSNYCWNLNGRAPAQSFRFIAQPCSGNNC